MSLTDRIRARWPKHAPVQYLPSESWSSQQASYRDAQPTIIDAALARSQRLPSGNWFVFAASAAVRGNRPFGTVVGGQEIVAWRDEGDRLLVGPGACPHLGAELCTGRVDAGALVCPWHGLRLDGGREFGWRPLPAHDDGVLAWVRLDGVGGEVPLASPVVPLRPSGSQMSAVIGMAGVCEPQDIIANRLDPWHGAWFHPYSFSRLEVLTSPPSEPQSVDEDRFTVAVTFHVGRLGVPVIAEFVSPEPRTIVMRIVEGEGAGSVVETHATPLGNGPDGKPRTAVTEAVIAHSERDGFAHAIRARPLFAPFMKRAAAQLWKDDLAYAERRFRIRTGDVGTVRS